MAPLVDSPVAVVYTIAQFGGWKAGQPCGVAAIDTVVTKIRICGIANDGILGRCVNCAGVDRRAILAGGVAAIGARHLSDR